MTDNKQVKIYTLSSGSSGNCTYIKLGDTEFLIDVGISMKSLKSALSTLGTELEKISAIFITHEHNDHIKGLKTLTKHYKIPIFVAEESLFALSDIDKSLLRPRTVPFSESLSDVTVISFPTPHDSRASCGYVIEWRGRKFGYATDMGAIMRNVAISLSECEAVILEANYDEKMLKNGHYPLFLKQRIASAFGHLDNESSAAFCSFLASNKTKRILLAHLSEENNTPEAALSAVSKKFSEDNVSADVRVAARHLPTELISTF